MEAWDDLLDEMKALSNRLDFDAPTEDELRTWVFQTLNELSACTSRPAESIEELVQNIRRWAFLSCQLYIGKVAGKRDTSHPIWDIGFNFIRLWPRFCESLAEKSKIVFSQCTAA